MQKIVPNLWFDTQVEEASAFYASTFRNVKIGNMMHYDEESSKVSGRPAGSVLTVEWSIDGYSFVGINGGPAFTMNPSISFMLNFDPSTMPDAREYLDAVWKNLSDGGKVLMELGEYPFSKHYGWIEDKYGVSWQLILTDPKGEPRPFIIPSMLFVGAVCGKANEAIDFYISTFGDARRGKTAPYPKGMEPDMEGTLMYADFTLADQWFVAMDSAHEHKFRFNEAVSLMVNCETQEEIDRYWHALSANPKAEQCGWLQDKFGVSWQIVPHLLEDMLLDKNTSKANAVMKAMLQMKKLDLRKLQEAYNG